VPYLAFPNNAPAAVKGSRSSRAERSGSARDGSEALTNRQIARAVNNQQAICLIALAVVGIVLDKGSTWLT
jgi:hypothetical protein